MARCSGCSSDRCSCVIRPGANISVTGVGTPTNPYVISAQGEEGQSVPAGTIVMYGGDVAPAGWLITNGSSVSRAAYAALFAAIGTAYGIGDGTTTFTLPNLVNRFPIGTSGTRPRGSVGGAVETVLTNAQIPIHSHTMNHTHAASFTASMNRNQVHAHSFDGAITGYQAGIAGGIHFGHVVTNPDYGEFINGANVDHEHFFQTPTYNGSTGTFGSGEPAAVPTMPPWQSVNFLIKT